MATKIRVQSQCEYVEVEKRPLGQYPRMVRCEGITNKDAHLCDYHAELRRQEVDAANGGDDPDD